MALTPDINILSFKNSYTIYENEVICKISDGELNMSQNPTLTTDANHVDIISFFWDADNEIAYGVASLDFQF